MTKYFDWKTLEQIMKDFKSTWRNSDLGKYFDWKVLEQIIEGFKSTWRNS